jgi:hypothetical protein
LLLVSFPAAGSDLLFQRVAGRCALAGLVMLAAFSGRNLCHAVVAGRPSRVHFPGRELAAAVDERWGEVSNEPLELIGGEWWAAGNAAFYHPERPNVFPEMCLRWAPWTDDETFQRKGGVIVWPLGDINYDDEVEAWLRRFPGVRITTPIELEARTMPATRRFAFGVAVVPPGKRLE